jgi:hypothetical protein
MSQTYSFLMLESCQLPALLGGLTGYANSFAQSPEIIVRYVI